MSAKYYITTTLPYVNAKPHLGFALEIIQADVLARWQRSRGAAVFFNTGTDEHGAKIFEKAKELGKTPLEYCDQSARPFLALKEKLNLSFDNFIRTTGARHIAAAQAFWKLCDDRGDIYKKPIKQNTASVVSWKKLIRNWSTAAVRSSQQGFGSH